jgi:hypothetical protein
MAKQKSHKARAKEMLEALGWQVADVEVPSRYSQVTNDLFGFIDLLAVSARGTLAVQVTSCSGGNVSSRTKKAMDEPRLVECLRANWQVEVWGVRDADVKDGSAVLARHFALERDEEGEHVVAYDGSQIL